MPDSTMPVSTAPADQVDTTPEPTQEPDLDWKAEAEKWKALARKHEGRAKDNDAAVKQLEQLQQASLSDSEKAVAEAEKRGRTAALTEVAQRLAAAEIRVALKGVVKDDVLTGIVDDLNLAKFVTAEGDVDAKSVAALKDRYAAMAPAAPVTDLKQGHRQAPAGEFDANAWLRNAAGVQAT